MSAPPAPMSGRPSRAALRRVLFAAGVSLVVAAPIVASAPVVAAAPVIGAVGSPVPSNPPRGIVGQRATVRVEISRTSSGLDDSSLSVVANVEREVVAATPGAGYTIRNTIVSIDTQAEGIDVQGYGFGGLRGAQFDQQANESGAIVAARGHSPAGLDLFDLALASTTVDLPISEMSTGAAWSGTLRAGNEVVADDVTYQAQLSAVGDNSFTVDLSFASSVSAELDDGRQFSGMLSGSETVTGRLDNRAAFDARLSQTIDGIVVDAAGAATPVRWNESIVVTTVD